MIGQRRTDARDVEINFCVEIILPPVENLDAGVFDDCATLANHFLKVAWLNDAVLARSQDDTIL